MLTIYLQVLRSLLGKAAIEGGVVLVVNHREMVEQMENATCGIVFLAASAGINDFGREIVA